MKLSDKLKYYLEYPLNPDKRSELESMFNDDIYPPLVVMGVVIMAFEALMIITVLFQGGPGFNTRSQIYFILYIALFCLTALFFFTMTCLRRKKENNTSLQINLTYGYSFLLCAWSCFLTLLDQHSGPNLNVYSYVLMAMAVFSMMRPWQSILLFGGGFLLFNGLAIAFQENPLFFSGPLNANNLIINSLFITILTIFISITLYRYRVMKKHDSIVIQKQYDQISAINQKLNDLAMTDQLTGMGNRRFLEEKMNELQNQDSLAYTNAVGIMLDIDFFKQYNDNYGHQAGDTCLKDIAKIMKAFAKKEHAFLVRYGGEEFFLCLTDCTNPTEKAEALRLEIVRQQLVRDDQPIGCVTVSIGVDVEERMALKQIGQDGFLRNCDHALYEAKNSGRNRVCIYEHDSFHISG